MLKRLLISAVLPGLISFTVLPARAVDAPKPVYQQMIKRYPPPALQDLTGREFKFLVDPAQLPKEPREALAALWKRFTAASEKAGFSTLSRQAGKPLKVEAAVKEYLDTPGQDLWKHRYLIRLTAKAKKGDGNLTVTVKAIHEDALRTLAAALTVVGADAKTESEGNVGVGPSGQLTEYVEKGSSWNVRTDRLGSFTLGDFAKFVPELLRLGLPAETRLVRTRVYAMQAKPGQLVLPEAGTLPVSMEAWSRTEGGEVFLLDLSYRSAGDYYKNAAAHQAAERFMAEVLCRDLEELARSDSGKWGGSKVRVLLDRPWPE